MSQILEMMNFSCVLKGRAAVTLLLFLAACLVPLHPTLSYSYKLDLMAVGFVVCEHSGDPNCSVCICVYNFRYIFVNPGFSSAALTHGLGVPFLGPTFLESCEQKITPRTTTHTLGWGENYHQTLWSACEPESHGSRAQPEPRNFYRFHLFISTHLHRNGCRLDFFAADLLAQTKGFLLTTKSKQTQRKRD